MNVPEHTAPLGRYVRHLAGAEFSLEANTPAAPEAGHFYVLERGEVILMSDDFAAAEACYKDLCKAHWDRNLESPEIAVSMASAWGLLGQNLYHPAAARIVQEHGSPADKKRLDQMRSRARAMAASRWKKAAAKPADPAPEEAAAAPEEAAAPAAAELPAVPLAEVPAA